MDESGDPGVAVVRDAFAAWNARDAEGLVACFAPDAEIDSAFARSEGDAAYRGHEGVRAWYENIVDTVGFVMEPHQFLSYRRFVLVLVAAQGEGQESGVRLTQEYGMVYEISDGRIRRMWAYREPSEAFEALGRLARG